MCCYAECHFAECLYAECSHSKLREPQDRNTVCLHFSTIEVHNTEEQILWLQFTSNNNTGRK
jgi:hypothetical protein